MGDIATDMIEIRDRLQREGCWQAAKAIDHALDCYGADMDPGYATSMKLVEQTPAERRAIGKAGRSGWKGCRR